METLDFEHGRVYFKQLGAERVNRTYSLVQGRNPQFTVKTLIISNQRYTGLNILQLNADQRYTAFNILQLNLDQRYTALNILQLNADQRYTVFNIL